MPADFTILNVSIFMILNKKYQILPSLYMRMISKWVIDIGFIRVSGHMEGR